MGNVLPTIWAVACESNGAMVENVGTIVEIGGVLERGAGLHVAGTGNWPARSPSRAPWLVGSMARLSLIQAFATRLAPASVLLGLALGVGTAGYRALGEGRWSLSECFYMTAITLSTVGFGELPEMATVPWAREWTVALIVFGSGSLVYFVSQITAIVVDGDLRTLVARQRMQHQIDGMKDHIVICGLGATGRHVVDELIVARQPFLLVDRSKERIEEVQEHAKRPIPHVIGDVVTEDKVLEEAGIGRARALVASLHDDRDNIYLVLSARALNDKLRILSKADDHGAAAKLRRAGANDVVLPALIGGMRIASTLVRPTVVQFLDEMLRDRERNYRIEEVFVRGGCGLDGLTVREIAGMGLADVLVLAVRDAQGRTVYQPSAATIVPADCWLIVLARMDEVVKLRGAVA